MSVSSENHIGFEKQEDGRGCSGRQLELDRRLVESNNFRCFSGGQTRPNTAKTRGLNIPIWKWNRRLYVRTEAKIVKTQKSSKIQVLEFNHDKDGIRIKITLDNYSSKFKPKFEHYDYWRLKNARPKIRQYLDSLASKKVERLRQGRLRDFINEAYRERRSLQ